MTVLAIVNQKGGVGKTTTTAALGVILARQGRAVHLVDMDHQADLTSALGQADEKGLLYEALTKRGPLPVVPVGENLTLTPSSIDLAGGETAFVSAVGREYLLKTCLAKTDLPKDVTVLIDCPPSRLRAKPSPDNEFRLEMLAKFKEQIAKVVGEEHGQIDLVKMWNFTGASTRGPVQRMNTPTSANPLVRGGG